MVRFENVSMSYGNNDVLKKINLHIEEGQLVVLIGPSGCGKTTTLQLINRLIEPTSGTVFVNGVDVQNTNPVQLRRNIGYVIQEIGLFPHMTIRQNIELVPAMLGWDAKRRAERTSELMKLANMDVSYLDRYPAKLSGGQQQRIGFLRALAAEPPIILMDEPFGALDPITRESLQDEIMRLQKQLHKTIIFVTHDMDEALKIADVIVLMNEGHIVQAATPRELLSNPADEFVENFIGRHRTRGNRMDTVADVMNTSVICALSDISEVEAVDKMRREHVSSLFITDDMGRLLGQVSIEDIQGAPLAEDSDIANLLRRDIPALKEQDSAQSAFSQMLKEHRDELPVVDADGRVVGVVTRRSMVVQLAREVWQGDRHE